MHTSEYHSSFQNLYITLVYVDPYRESCLEHAIPLKIYTRSPSIVPMLIYACESILPSQEYIIKSN